MINCILGLVADADEVVQEGTQKVLEGMTKAVTDPANAEKATFVNVSGFNHVLRGFSVVAFFVCIVYLFSAYFSNSNKIPKWVIIAIMILAVIGFVASLF